MRLRKLITEAKERSVSISMEEVFEGIRSHCKNALNDHKTGKSFYRGMETGGDFYFVKPGEYTRISRNTFNLYTLLIDNSKRWAKYPKRSKSIICTSRWKTADDYGQAYVVFPKDGYKIGVCPNHDMWYSFSSEINTSLHNFNYRVDQYLHDLGIEFSIDHMRDYNDLKLMCKKIDMVLQNTQERNTATFHWVSKYDRYGNFLDLLEDLFDPQDNDFKLETNIDRLPGGDHELWTDSDCYLISRYWLMKDDNNEKLMT